MNRQHALRRCRRSVLAAALVLASLPLVLSFLAPLAPNTAAAAYRGQALADANQLPSEFPQADPTFTVVRVAGPFAFPWSIALLPDNRMLVTERPGRIVLLEPTGDAAASHRVEGVPQVLAADHAGLLDVALDPGFASNQRLYLSYAHGTEEALTLRIFRARLVGSALLDGEVIFETRPAVAGVLQLGGRLAFGADGMLYLTVGDRFQGARAQDLQDHSGSILRIRPDGGVPDDNPFRGSPEVLPEIFSYGHRNPQGLTVEPASGRLWAIEHGPQGGDELNLIEAGHNYGWPVTTYGIDYDNTPIGIGPEAPGITPPVHHWTPSIAPSGLTFYHGAAWPEWEGQAVLGSLAGQKLFRLDLGSLPLTQEVLIDGEVGRIRDVRTGPDGLIYFVTDDPEGFLYRLEPVIEQSARKRSTG
ncbi:PQQ-dependent sugar dehydrogenase [Chelatococcus sp. GCM10030263]|uniref:PQQ-dependent sugar dehydrogenase n=1 Tax=Chelatococcus sp. GCM10030263 TaxID=3273387 RepID=UPI0036147EE9